MYLASPSAASANAAFASASAASASATFASVRLLPRRAVRRGNLQVEKPFERESFPGRKKAQNW